MTTELPRDPALPGLVAIRSAGLARAIPALGVEDGPVELILHAYKRGARAALEVRVGGRRLAVKAYARDPAPEAELYETLAAAGLAPSGPGTGLAGDSDVSVPALVAWDRDLRILVVGWLEGVTAKQLLRNGQGKRAGELAACWLRRATSLPVTLGPPFGAERRLQQAGEWVAALGAADPALGTAAAAVAASLARTAPKEGARRLVHGSLHDRNLLALGGGPGVIDWQRFGQGPAELDAGMFLGSIARHRLLRESLVGEATRAEEAFLAGTRGLLDERALAWHRAAALLRAAVRVCKELPRQKRRDWLARARALLGEAARLAEASG